MNKNSTPQTVSQEKRTPIYAGSRIVGEVWGSVFRKNLAGSKHFLRSPRAISSDDSVIADAKRAGAVEIAVRDIETGLVYTAPLVEFDKHGFPVRRGFGNQTGLPMERWTVSRAGVVVQPAKVDATPSTQFSLFDTTDPATFEKPDLT